MAQSIDRTVQPAPEVDEDVRPTTILPLGQLVAVSVYWLGLSAIFAGVNPILTGRLQFDKLVPEGTEGAALVQMTIAGSIVAAVLQPTVGAISDYTTSRWGRRKPYILVGSLLDIVFLAGVAMSNTVVTIAAFFLLLQVSSNFAQGPFQGYVPDLVPEPQVGLASALLGIFSVLGNVVGVVIAAFGVRFHQYAIATLALGVVEVATMLVVFFRVREGRVAKDRRGRSWGRVALSAWGADILRERSFLWLLGSRLSFLMAGGILFNLQVFYMARSQGLGEAETGTILVVLAGALAVANVAAVIPSARLSDRIGRKPVIWGACAIGAAGMAIVMLAPNIPLAFVGAVLYGIANGTFLAVDWALMTDIIPKASSGRYMGLSNVATAASGILAVAVGGTIIDLVGGPSRAGSGPRAALAVAVALYLVAAALLRPVREPLRGARVTARPTTVAATSTVALPTPQAAVSIADPPDDTPDLR